MHSDGEPTSDRSAIGVPVMQTVVADIHRDGGDKLSARSTTTQRPMMRKEQILSDQRYGTKAHTTKVGLGRALGDEWQLLTIGFDL